MNLFKLVYGIDVITALVILYFFFAGIGDGTVNNRNITLWLFILIALAIIMGGSILLRNSGHTGIAMALVFLLAIPAILFVLYFGIAMLNHERWN